MCCQNARWGWNRCCGCRRCSECGCCREEDDDFTATLTLGDARTFAVIPTGTFNNGNGCGCGCNSWNW